MGLEVMLGVTKQLRVLLSSLGDAQTSWLPENCEAFAAASN